MVHSADLGQNEGTEEARSAGCTGVGLSVRLWVSPSLPVCRESPQGQLEPKSYTMCLNKCSGIRDKQGLTKGPSRL